MSHRWMYRTAAGLWGPLTVEELAQRLRAHSNSQTDEVRPADVSEWIPLAAVENVLLSGDAAANAAAVHLLQTAAVLQLAQATPAEPSPPPWAQRLQDLRGTPASLLLAALISLAALVILGFRSAPRTNAAAYVELSLWRTRLGERLDRDGAAAPPLRARARPAIRSIIDDLESAARRQPVLRIGSDQTAAADVLARRELLSAARDLMHIAESESPSPALDESCRRHLQQAADRLGILPPSPGRGTDPARTPPP